MRIQGDAFKNIHASGLMRRSKMRLGNKGMVSKDNPGCFFGRNEVSKIMIMPSGRSSIADERNAENKVRNTKKMISVLVVCFPVV
jgi:hypothetical protein